MLSITGDISASDPISRNRAYNNVPEKLKAIVFKGKQYSSVREQDEMVTRQFTKQDLQNITNLLLEGKADFTHLESLGRPEWRSYTILNLQSR
jgi:hypothetical protein